MHTYVFIIVLVFTLNIGFVSDLIMIITHKLIKGSKFVINRFEMVQNLYLKLKIDIFDGSENLFWAT